MNHYFDIDFYTLKDLNLRIGTYIRPLSHWQNPEEKYMKETLEKLGLEEAIKEESPTALIGKANSRGSFCLNKESSAHSEELIESVTYQNTKEEEYALDWFTFRKLNKPRSFYKRTTITPDVNLE